MTSNIEFQIINYELLIEVEALQEQIENLDKKLIELKTEKRDKIKYERELLRANDQVRYENEQLRKENQYLKEVTDHLNLELMKYLNHYLILSEENRKLKFELEKISHV